VKYTNQYKYETHSYGTNFIGRLKKPTSHSRGWHYLRVQAEGKGIYLCSSDKNEENSPITMPYHWQKPIESHEIYRLSSQLRSHKILDSLVTIVFRFSCLPISYVNS